MREIQSQAQPLHYARLVVSDDKVHELPELELACAGGLQPGFAIIRVRASYVADSKIGGIWWRDDGRDPEPGEGMPCEVGSEERYEGDPANFKLVKSNFVGSVDVHVAYYVGAVVEVA